MDVPPYSTLSSICDALHHRIEKHRADADHTAELLCALERARERMGLRQEGEAHESARAELLLDILAMLVGIGLLNPSGVAYSPRGAMPVVIRAIDGILVSDPNTLGYAGVCVIDGGVDLFSGAFSQNATDLPGGDISYYRAAVDMLSSLARLQQKLNALPFSSLPASK
jgi:hypothetical protein